MRRKREQRRRGGSRSGKQKRPLLSKLAAMNEGMKTLQRAFSDFQLSSCKIRLSFGGASQ
jgi:hypothetical protein